jgi:sugar phosphate isomerase/epimerase
MGKLPISVQLYSIRDYTANDFAAAVTKIAQIGYTHVELAGFGDLKSAAEARKALDGAGLKVSGAHIEFGRWANLGKVLDEADVLGNENLIIPWIDTELRTVDGYRHVARVLNQSSIAAKARGKRVAYHNHDFELRPPDGPTPDGAPPHAPPHAGSPAQCGLDLIWSNTDADSVFAELDLFWLKVGGVDPLAYLHKLGRRTLIVHLKDQSKIDPNRFAEVGTGTLDFAALIGAAAELGVQFGTVEQDDCYGQDPMQAVRTSFCNLQKMGLV